MKLPGHWNKQLGTFRSVVDWARHQYAIMRYGKHRKKERWHERAGGALPDAHPRGKQR